MTAGPGDDAYALNEPAQTGRRAGLIPSATAGPHAIVRGHGQTEKQLAASVRDLARLFGWHRYHTHRSDFSPAGFPDETLVRPPRLIFAELKSDNLNSKPSPAQQEWLHTLGQIPGIEVYLWRPKDLDQIVRILR